jgi:hypothetical protein
LTAGNSDPAPPPLPPPTVMASCADEQRPGSTGATDADADADADAGGVADAPAAPVGVGDGVATGEALVADGVGPPPAAVVLAPDLSAAAQPAASRPAAASTATGDSRRSRPVT